MFNAQLQEQHWETRSNAFSSRAPPSYHRGDFNDRGEDFFDRQDDGTF
jgi:hypothetical protein